MIPALLLLLTLTSLGNAQRGRLPRLQVFARIEKSKIPSLRGLLETLQEGERRKRGGGHPFSFRLRTVGIPSKGGLPPVEVFDLALGIPRVEVLRKKKLLWKSPSLPEGWVLLGLRLYAPFLGGKRLTRVGWPEFLRRAPQSLLLPDPLVEPSIVDALASVGEAYGRDRIAGLVLAGGLVRFLTSKRIRERLGEGKQRFGVMVLPPGEGTGGGERLPAGRLMGVVSRGSRNPELAGQVLLALRERLWEKPLFGEGPRGRRRVLVGAKAEELLRVASYWGGGEEQAGKENWVDTLLLFLFGLGFLGVLWTALRPHPR